MNTHQKPDKTVAAKGFSLTELLVVIAVIGVIAAIAIPGMSGIFKTSNQAKVRQNAQSLASVFANSRACGATFAAYDKDTVINALTSVDGVHGKGNLAEVVFKVPMDAVEIQSVKDSTTLVGDGTGDEFRLIFTGL